MTRGSGQNGYIEKKGKSYHVRFRIDVPGQEKRKYKSIPICPVSGPGKMTKPERERRAREIVIDRGADTEEHFNQVEAVNLGITFRQQAERWLEQSQARKRQPVKAKTVSCWRSILNRWLGADLGAMPLSMVNNLAVKTLVAKLHGAGQSPNSIRNITNVVKQVVASAKDDQGEELFPRKWNHEFIDMPLIVQEELNTPTFAPEEVNRLVAEESRYRMLYVLLAATGMRIGEAMAPKVSGVVDNYTTLQIRETYWLGRFGPPKHNSKRDVDLPAPVAAMLRQHLAGRTSGFVFQTRSGRPDNDILGRHLYPLLDRLGLERRGFHAFRRFRISALRASGVPGEDGVPEHLISYWTGHKDRSMNGLYDYSARKYVAWRKEWAEKAGCGFEIRVE